ncbi:MAG: hypothetical protein R3F24_12825 [Gammaproteobacteria bacterium]
MTTCSAQHSQRPRWLGFAAAALLAVSPLAAAAESHRADDATFGTMVVDAAIARPLGLGATVVGSVLWVVTLPFSALGGNIDEATNELVKKPARYTFMRPLGEL